MSSSPEPTPYAGVKVSKYVDMHEGLTGQYIIAIWDISPH